MGAARVSWPSSQTRVDASRRLLKALKSMGPKILSNKKLGISVRCLSETADLDNFLKWYRTM